MNKEENKKPSVEVYTDGACSGNPGKGGYGAVLRYKTNNGEFVTKELSEGFLFSSLFITTLSYP